MVPEPIPLAIGTHLGPYQIFSIIASGGMGDVYRARDNRLDRTVAVKVLKAHASTDPTRRQRFEREARIVSHLNHPHICTLFDVGQQNGTDYLVMEYLEGETLAERLKICQGRPLPLTEALAIAMQIGDALDAAHGQGVVHRDLKPSNVMLTKTDVARSALPQVKLLDFGIAKTMLASTAAPGGAGGDLSGIDLRETLTGDGRLLGTPQYMAPEQLEGREADTRSDIFAFGAVLYEMLTGRRAFIGESQASVIAAILDNEVPPIAKRQLRTRSETTSGAEPGCHSSLPLVEEVVRRCLVKDPQERWQTAADLINELRRIQEATSSASTAIARFERRSLAVVFGLSSIAAAFLDDRRRVDNSIYPSRGLQPGYETV